MFPVNRTKVMLDEGRVPLGIEFVTGSLRLMEIIGWAGFDYVMLDMEHASFGYSEIEDQVRAALGAGMTPFVRVAEKNNPTCIQRVLETGAHGIVLPQVQTADEVRQAVDAMRYAPEGSRGMCPVTRAAHYSGSAWREYVEWSRENVLLMPLIEDPVGIANADEICALPDVTLVGLGAGDLGQHLGCGADCWSAPAVQEAGRALVEAARRHGVVVEGMPDATGDFAEALRSLLDFGFGMVMCDCDAVMVQALCGRMMEGARTVLERDGAAAAG